MSVMQKLSNYLKEINQDAAINEKVNLIPEDAFTYLFNNTEKYDIFMFVVTYF